MTMAGIVIMHRLFVGLEIPEAIKMELIRLRDSVRGAQWQQFEQLHLTLGFLGEVDSNQLTVVERVLDEPLAEEFFLRVRGVGCFGDPDSPRNLWAGVDAEIKIVKLHSVLVSRFKEVGVAINEEGFKPHITLARFDKNPGSVKRIILQNSRFDSPSFKVNQVALFESSAGLYGSNYKILKRFDLARHP